MKQPLPVHSRNAAIDHIRIFLTLLVIFHHVSIAYGGSGGWYWKEVEDGSNPLLIFFNAVNQSYFMGFFFLLAGYYTAPSFERKGAMRFTKERLLRLGIPLTVYFFGIAPFTVGLIRHHEGAGLFEGWWNMILAKEFEPGPLWFAEALLLFTCVYVGWRLIRGKGNGLKTLPGALPLTFWAMGLGLVSFGIRLWLPVGESVLWLQLGYFPCYIFLFFAGILCSQNQLLERITFRQSWPWMLVSAVAFAILVAVFFTRSQAGSFSGGWNLNALFYALWDPFMAWGMILGLLWLSGKWFAGPTVVGSWLAGNAYGAYIVHPPIVVGFSLAFSQVGWQPTLKLLVVGCLSCLCSLLLAALLRTIPGSRKIL
ncbi:MAG: acyltransferase [Puniceicoccaceae bacterium]